MSENTISSGLKRPQQLDIFSACALVIAGVLSGAIAAKIIELSITFVGARIPVSTPLIGVAAASGVAGEVMRAFWAALEPFGRGLLFTT